MAANKSVRKSTFERPGASPAGQVVELIVVLAVVAAFFAIVVHLLRVTIAPPTQDTADESGLDGPAGNEATANEPDAERPDAERPAAGEPVVIDSPPETAITARPPLTRRRQALGLARRVAGVALDTALIAAVVLAVFVAYGLVNNRWYHVLVVEGGSMYPTITAGDLIVITPPPAQIEPGMILTMEVDNSVVTHRVEKVNPDGTFVTKGDANSVGDDFSGNTVGVVGQYLFRIPLIGNLLPTGDAAVAHASGAWFSALLTVGGSAEGSTWSAIPAP